MGYRPRATSLAALVCAPLLISLLPGCASAPEPSIEERLVASFPEHAGRVLATEAAFISTSHGFSLATSDLAFRGVSADLPVTGDGLVRLTLMDGSEIRVRELGLTGDASPVKDAIAYRRAGGTSFWTAIPGGVEEWLHLEAGALGADGLAASWEIEGALLHQRGDVIEVVAPGGLVKARVTAPVAYAAGGREIHARLVARGTAIDLFVDPTSEEVLIDPVWSSAASMITGRRLHASAKLNDGRVLVMGGSTSGGFITASEIYDPTANTWTATGSLAVPRSQHAAAALNDGRVLIAGGLTTGGSYLTTAEIYDPATGTFSGAGTTARRSGHTMTKLADGKILIAGGWYNGILATAEIYDPSSGTFSAAASMPRAHQSHTATLLDDGRVLIAGNYSSVFADMAIADVYNPATNTWAMTPLMTSARYFHVAGKLQDGRVILAGGTSGVVNSSAEIYNPATNTWSAVPSMSTPRSGPGATMLPDGTFLVLGGYTGSSYPVSSERYNPSTNTWSSAGNMPGAHYKPVVELLSGGSAIAAGGSSQLNSTLATADLYSPLGGLGSPCSNASECGSGFCVDGVCCNSACAGGTTDCQACSVAAGGSQDGTCSAITNNTNNCAPTCVTIQRGTFGGVSDAHISQGSPNNNYGTSNALSIGLTSSARNGLVQFDLSSIPSNAVIASATLTLRVIAGGGSVLRAHRVTAAWSESTVTWASFADAYLAAVEATASLSGSDYTADLTALTQAWVSGSFTNNGVLLERDLTAATTLQSSESATVSVRPKLTVCYMQGP